MCDELVPGVDGRGAATNSTEDDDRKAPHRWIYRNLTPWRIHACFDADKKLLCREDTARPEQGCDDGVAQVLSIPALGEITLPNEDARRMDTIKMRRLGQVDVRPAASELWSCAPRAIVIYGWLLVGLFFGGWALLFGGGSALPWAAVIACVVAVPLAALVVATIREMRVYNRFTNYRKHVKKKGENGGERNSLEGVDRGNRIRSFVDGMPRHAAEVAVLIGAVVISVIGLGLAIHHTTQLKELLPIDYGALAQLENPFEATTELARSSPAFWQLLTGHIAQWILVSVAALAPALMYFQFDRERLASVQGRWVHDVFRLDTTVRTVRDVEARYGSQIESAFGELGPDSALRLRGGRRSPVIVATVLLVLGWFLVISTTKVPPLVEAETPTGAELVWSTAGDDAESFPVSSFFRPNLTVVGYAFLGAYVFTLFHVLRGYHRRDLHPKTYNTAVVRILAAYALALVAAVVADGPGAEVVMFFVGFTPQSALVWLREQMAKGSGVWNLLPLHEPAPLTDLEGIDLYDRTRLAEEGINNVEALAHADIVELMSSTRISAAQLVDWTDQALLYLRVGGDASAQVEHAHGLWQRLRGTVTRALGNSQPSTDAAADPPAASDAVAENPEGSDAVGAAPTEPPVPDVRRNLCHLRSFGIRTATDLIQAFKEAAERDRLCGNGGHAEVDALRDALELRPTPHPIVRSIQTIIDTLPDEEWFVQVHNWRASEFGAADAWYSYLDGHDWQVQCAEHDRRQPKDPDVPRVPLAECSTAPGSDGHGEPSDQPVSAGAPTGGADGEMAVSR
jgi:hypothetical protein